MKTFSYSLTLIAFLLFHLLTAVTHAENTSSPGSISGGKAYELPDWFKDSFLEITDDVTEAKENNKHVILFFHLNNCPYCDKMLKEGIDVEPNKAYLQQHFDIIGINIRGDREVIFDENTTLVESELARQLKVRATPTLLFLNTENDAVVRLNGYRSPTRFYQILRYVADKAYTHHRLDEYIAQHAEQNVYHLRNNDLFSEQTDLSTKNTPLAVIFEDSQCDECTAFHDKILSRDDVQAELKKLTVVRLDADSEQEIIDTEGNKTTPKTWAKALKLTYRPGVVLFDEGKEILRIDGMLYSFHFKEMLRYVSGGYYKQFDGFFKYLRPRQEALVAQGVHINLAE